jgi:hypothetical protein
MSNRNLVVLTWTGTTITATPMVNTVTIILSDIN